MSASADETRARTTLRGPTAITPTGRPRMIHNTCMDRAPIPQEWRDEFDAAAARPFSVRMRYAFVHTYKPVLDDAPYRSFDSTAEYRRWCAENLPDWLGYGTD